MNIKNVKLETSLISRNEQNKLYDPTSRNTPTKNMIPVMKSKDQFIPTRRTDTTQAGMANFAGQIRTDKIAAGALGVNTAGIQVTEKPGAANPGQAPKPGAILQNQGTANSEQIRTERLTLTTGAFDMNLAAGQIPEIPGATKPGQGATLHNFGLASGVPQRLERNPGNTDNTPGGLTAGLEKSTNRAALPVPNPAEPPQKGASQPIRTASPLENERPGAARTGMEPFGGKPANPADNTREKTVGLNKREAERAMNQTRTEQNPMLNLLG